MRGNAFLKPLKIHWILNDCHFLQAVYQRNFLSLDIQGSKKFLFKSAR